MVNTNIAPRPNQKGYLKYSAKPNTAETAHVFGRDSSLLTSYLHFRGRAPPPGSLSNKCSLVVTLQNRAPSSSDWNSQGKRRPDATVWGLCFRGGKTAFPRNTPKCIITEDAMESIHRRADNASEGQESRGGRRLEQSTPRRALCRGAVHNQVKLCGGEAYGGKGCSLARQLSCHRNNQWASSEHALVSR